MQDTSGLNIIESLLMIDQPVEKFRWLCPMKEIIFDQGSEFVAHRIHDDGSWNRKFEDCLIKYGIKPVLASEKHPPTNGKLEQFFGEYVKHRSAFYGSSLFSVGMTWV